MGDVLPLLDGRCKFVTTDGKEHEISDKWDLIIAHPPCTFMSNAGACRMYPRKGQIDQIRLKKAIEAREFFLKIFHADCEKICIENPMPLKVVNLPKENQRIQPYMFGEPYSKKTYLWLKGLHELKPTNIIKDVKPFLSSGIGKKLGGESYGAQECGHNSKSRSKTFVGIAKAMADQKGGKNVEINQSVRNRNADASRND